MCEPADIDLAERLAALAGGVIRGYFRTAISVDDKADASPVTIADRNAEAAMRAVLERERPNDGIIGEEHGRTRGDASRQWVLDPIDGTKSFISGIPVFGTLIALLQDGAPILGIIDQPISGERWIGATGRPSTLNGRPISVRPTEALGNATLFATHPDMFAGDDAERFTTLREAVKLNRYGGDCYAYGLLAGGWIDLVAEASMQLYDFAALAPVVEGAGGVMSDWQGRPLGLGAGRSADGHVLAAATPALHRAALGALSG